MNRISKANDSLNESVEMLFKMHSTDGIHATFEINKSFDIKKIDSSIFYVLSISSHKKKKYISLLHKKAAKDKKVVLISLPKNIGGQVIGEMGENIRKASNDLEIYLNVMYCPDVAKPKKKILSTKKSKSIQKI